MSKSVIYGLKCSCHPEDGIRYVGQTRKGAKTRIPVLKWNSRTETSKNYISDVSAWIREHGEDNLEQVILEECPPEMLDERETHWIKTLKEQGQDLTNVKFGDPKIPGFKVPKISLSQIGEKNPMYGRDRRDIMAHARSFNKPMTQENRNKAADRMRGSGSPTVKLTEEDVRDIRSHEYRRGLHAELARKYGVSGNQIFNIRERRSWAHVED